MTIFSKNDTELFKDLFDAHHGMKNLPVYILVYVVIFGCASFIGTCGNILILLTMFVTKSLRVSHNAFIVSLAIADLMVSSVTMPASITGVLLGKRFYEERHILCAFVSSICAPGCVASMHSIAWIAVSRYYYIAEYAAFTIYFTRNRILLYIFSIWLLGIVVHLPNHFGWGKTRYSFMLRYCSLDTDLLSYAVFYSSVLVFAIVVAFVFYLKIYLVLRKSRLSKSIIVGHKEIHNGNTTPFTDEIKIVKTSFKIFVLFLITWSPLCILFLMNIGDKVPPWLYLYAALTAHGNSTLNFIVYFLENDIFRKAMKDCFNKVFRKTNKISTMASYHKSPVRKNDLTIIRSPSITKGHISN